MSEESSKIDCEIFQRQEPLVREITDNINRAKNVLLKAKYAEELNKETEVLLSCSNFSNKEKDCKNCRFIANLRKKTAELVIKSKKLV